MSHNYLIKTNIKTSDNIINGSMSIL